MLEKENSVVKKYSENYEEENILNEKSIALVKYDLVNNRTSILD